MQRILFFVLLIISVPTFAQSVTISGQARGASGKTPLAFVTVTLHRAADSRAPGRRPVRHSGTGNAKPT